nr:MAG: dUTPase [Porcellio scaber clopovirus]
MSKNIVIPRGTFKKISLDIRIKLPPKCYGRIALRSKSAMKGIDIRGGVINNSYRGDIYVMLRNERSDKNLYIPRRCRLVQLIIQKYKTAKIEQVENIASIDFPPLKILLLLLPLLLLLLLILVLQLLLP